MSVCRACDAEQSGTNPVKNGAGIAELWSKNDFFQMQINIASLEFKEHCIIGTICERLNGENQ